MAMLTGLKRHRLTVVRRGVAGMQQATALKSRPRNGDMEARIHSRHVTIFDALPLIAGSIVWQRFNHRKAA